MAEMQTFGVYACNKPCSGFPFAFIPVSHECRPENDVGLCHLFYSGCGGWHCKQAAEAAQAFPKQIPI
jgi:hypothetical protein